FKLRKMDKNLDTAVEFGDGIRILNQDPFEMIITFILSANNRIPMIMRAVNGLSEKYGDYICEINGKKFYEFPSSDKLSSAEISELRLSGVGFRDKYVSKTSNMINGDQEFIDKLIAMDYINAFKELQKLSGVGPKVADCIALFSLQKYQAFPVDTWVKKVMEHFYIKEDSSFKLIKEYADNNYGNIAGFAQQYLFYYARENKIG
ncbi:MAG: 8-oxoguanine DNA glycosylase, partial [Acidaminobacteraceae bacterium]